MQRQRVASDLHGVNLAHVLLALSLAEATSRASVAAPVGCWTGALSADTCCDASLFGPNGNEACWDEEFTFEVCCSDARQIDDGIHRTSAKVTSVVKSSQPAAVKRDDAVPELKPKDERAARRNARRGSETSRKCWRGGFTFFKCCKREYPEGNPQCWDDVHTYETCCLPPVPTHSAFRFEDVNCDRRGPLMTDPKYDNEGNEVPSEPLTWRRMRGHIGGLLAAADRGDLRNAVDSIGGFGNSARHLRDTAYRARLQGECPLGIIALHAMSLLLCLAFDDDCNSQWGKVAKAMRYSDLEIVPWVASAWQLNSIFKHLGRVVQENDPACNVESNGVNWPYFHQASQEPGMSHSVQAAIMGLQKSSPFRRSCEGGTQWLSVIQMAWCAKTEIVCVSGYETLLTWKMRLAAQSGTNLRRWIAQSASWNIYDWEIGVLYPAMRHHYNVGLTVNELEIVGIELPLPRSPLGCLVNEMFVKGIRREGLVVLAIDDVKTGHEERCRVVCGWSRDENSKVWDLYGFNRYSSWDGVSICTCARADLQLDHAGCNTSQHPLMYQMPTRRSHDELVAEILRVGSGDAPVFSQAAASLSKLNEDAPVFTTMNFGHMAKYLLRFGAHVARLQIPNVVVFVLDKSARDMCQQAQRDYGKPDVCLEGKERTALQKYIVVLSYLLLDRDVFWFDFDSIWLQNPMAAIRSHEAKAEVSNQLVPEGRPLIYSAIDYDSLNCGMNAFFLIKSHRESLAWLLALMHWFYTRPYAHDQLAYSLFLGMVPLVDEEPLPEPIPMASLDPNVFANAARFAGLGFHGDVDDIVLFHFFDGWNSNAPGDVEMFATPVYKQFDLFEVLYGSDAEAAKAAIARSKLPVPKEHKDCRITVDLGLGVELVHAEPEIIMMP